MQSLSLASLVKICRDMPNKVPQSPTSTPLLKRAPGFRDHLSNPSIQSTFVHPQGMGSVASAIRCVNRDEVYEVRFSVLLYVQFSPENGAGREEWYGAECV